MRDSTKARDAWLALRCQAGVDGAFDTLIAEMERPLFYYAIKLTGNQDRALDVLQEVWMRSLRGIRKLKDPSSVRAWLYTMVRGIAIDDVRRDQSRERAEEIHAQTDDSYFSADDAVAVHQSLDRLEPKHRELLALFFLEEFSLAEISQILGCPEGTVKSRVYYAKKALKEAMSGDQHARKL